MYLKNKNTVQGILNNVNSQTLKNFIIQNMTKSTEKYYKVLILNIKSVLNKYLKIARKSNKPSIVFIIFSIISRNNTP